MDTIHPDQEFEAFLREGRFMLQRGVESGRAVFYPRQFEPGSGADLEWFEASGRGVVYATTAIHPRNAGPYNVALIDLVEGVRMMSRVDGPAPSDVPIGMAVRAKIIDQDGAPLVVFVPASPQ